MSGNQKVTVLTTNGRRQNVSVTPNTTLLQILEQVCQKHDFKSNEHGLKHHKKVLDLTLTFRFSGLPNNCLLEMFKTEEPRDDNNNVVLCVQLETGERFQGDFKSTQTVEEVLNNLCKNQFETMDSPIVFYMRQEIFGESIKATTLKSLGLTGGRAIVRLLDKKPEELKMQANVYVPPTEKPSKPKSDDEEEKSPKKATKDSKSFDVVEVVKSLKNRNNDAEKLKEEEREDDENVSPIKKEDNTLQEERKSPYTWGEGAGHSMIEKSENNDATLETETIQDMEDDPVIHELGERNAVAFSLESVHKGISEIPDSFFDLTASDLRLLLRDLRKEAAGNDDAPLLTNKLRELEASKRVLRKLEQYKHCVIRVQFPDRIVLQGKFRPTESILDVHNFLKKYLKNSETNFHLFTIPPKQVLDPIKTLVEVDCVPTALLHFGVEGGGNSEEEGQKYLIDDLYSKLSSPDGALLTATKSRGLVAARDKVESNEPSSSQSSPSTGAVPKKPKSEDFRESKATSSGNTKDVPKWFKPFSK